MPTLAYTDLNYYVSSAEIEAIQDIGTPLVGTGSLRIRRASGASDVRANFAPKTPDFAQGVTRGRLRALFKQVTITSFASQSYGLMCMQSQRDMSGMAGSAYTLRFRFNLAEIVKITTGLGGTTGITTLGTSGAIVPGSGINGLQLEWAYIPEVGGTLLFGYHGTASDFSDLVQVVSANDQSSPLTTSVTEGGFYRDGAAGSDFDIRYDQMRLQGP